MLGQTPSELKGAARAIFAELIDNIFSPSRTELDGYAAPQVYFSRRRLPDRHRYFDDLATGTEWSLTAGIGLRFGRLLIGTTVHHSRARRLSRHSERTRKRWAWAE
jgi:hypothetical protein